MAAEQVDHHRPRMTERLPSVNVTTLDLTAA
jgi:hypothetical protein